MGVATFAMAKKNLSTLDWTSGDGSTPIINGGDLGKGGIPSARAMVAQGSMQMSEIIKFLNNSRRCKIYIKSKGFNSK